MRILLLLVATILFNIQVDAQRANDSERLCRSDRIYPDTLNKKRVATVAGVAGGTYIAGLTFLGAIWYKDHARVPFHYYDDSKGYLQMDKAGHAYAAYYQSLVMTRSLRWAGVSKKASLIIGGSFGLIMQTPIEIFDGLYEGWGFSWSDMIANTSGALLFTVQEALWEDQIVRMKFSYSPSGYPEYHPVLGQTPLESFFNDYNGHTYWLSANIKKTTKLKVPAWLNLSFGYSANGMIYEFDNPKYYRGQPFPHLERYRQYLFSLDLDLSKVKTKSKFLRSLLGAANMLKVPFPAIEFNKVDGVKWHWLYF
ncbi:MAG: DUF2279 domain-containing protein [Crocinitomicaceae bacterium]|nr:DUF2279 domain-containing protein [Crocinitomicaceae bacterium]